MKYRLNKCAAIAAIAIAGLFSAAHVEARTVEITGSAFDQAAALDSRAPELGWAGGGGGRNVPTYSAGAMHVTPGKTLLLRYDLEGVIPDGMRITRALWVLPVLDHAPDRVRFEVWRMIADWGPGVNHNLRTSFPEQQPWGEPGGRAHGVDRALSATAATVVDSEDVDVTINVTRDVELWHSGAAENHGWMITVDDAGGSLTLPAVIGSPRKDWKLRITYEPE